MVHNLLALARFIAYRNDNHNKKKKMNNQAIIDQAKITADERNFGMSHELVEAIKAKEYDPFIKK